MYTHTQRHTHVVASDPCNPVNELLLFCLWLRFGSWWWFLLLSFDVHQVCLRLFFPFSRLFEVDGDAAVSPRPRQASLHIKGLLVLWLSLRYIPSPQLLLLTEVLFDCVFTLCLLNVCVYMRTHTHTHSLLSFFTLPVRRLLGLFHFVPDCPLVAWWWRGSNGSPATLCFTTNVSADKIILGNLLFLSCFSSCPPTRRQEVRVKRAQIWMNSLLHPQPNQELDATRDPRSHHVAAEVTATLPGNPPLPVAAATGANWLMRINFLSPGQFLCLLAFHLLKCPTVWSLWPVWVEWTRDQIKHVQTMSEKYCRVFDGFVHNCYFFPPSWFHQHRHSHQILFKKQSR